jgi:hypothetical protein
MPYKTPQQSEEYPTDQSSSDESMQSPLRNKHGKQKGTSAIREASHRIDILDSDPPDNLEYSQASSPGLLTPRGNSRASRASEPLQQSNRLKRTAAELDYSEDILHDMTYSELKDQPFDTDPKATTSVIPEALLAPDVPFDQRMKHFANEIPTLQREFFENMNNEDYEQAGEWFMVRFSEIRAKLNDVRHEKREVTKNFEEELAARESAVQGKIKNIDQSLAEMKQGGESVLNRL